MSMALPEEDKSNYCNVNNGQHEDQRFVGECCCCFLLCGFIPLAKFRSSMQTEQFPSFNLAKADGQNAVPTLLVLNDLL